MRRTTFFQFTAPSNIVMIVLLVFPLMYAVWLGMNFITFRTFNDPVFVGLENFRTVLADPAFWASLRWTLIIVVVTVPIHMILGFVIALFLDQVTGRMRAFYLAAALIPMVVVPLIGTIIFKQLFDPPGLVAWAYKTITGNLFIFDATSMKALILVHTIWIITPWAIVLFFAGMQTISEDLVDASSIDGASRLQQIWHVMIPHLRPLILLTLLIAVMDMFRLFDNVFVLTRLNPVFGADTVMTYNYKAATVVNRLGLANAVAIILVIAIVVALIPLLYVSYRDQIEAR
ncbi:MAG: sugar ABC transporter permease [Actinobacteria bacterium]|nr:sugar ABC transporter permease [Actinomycetota bacterium]